MNIHEGKGREDSGSTCISSKSLRAFFLISNRGGTSSILNLFKSANKD